MRRAAARVTQHQVVRKSLASARSATTTSSRTAAPANKLALQKKFRSATVTQSKSKSSRKQQTQQLFSSPQSTRTSLPSFSPYIPKRGFHATKFLSYKPEHGVYPLMSEKSFELHYMGIHHNQVKKLNELIMGTGRDFEDLETLVRWTARNKEEGMLFNYAAEVWNHNFFFASVMPTGLNPQKAPTAHMAQRLEMFFGSVNNFKKEFKDRCISSMGSNWVWLVDDEGHLEIMTTFGPGTPIAMGKHVTPLLGLDMWEHAYYFDFQNDKEDYIESYWQCLNWQVVQHNLEKAPPEVDWFGKRLSDTPTIKPRYTF